MTTAHVSAALLDGPPPTESELLAGLTYVLQRHPLLAARVVGKSKFHLPDAKPYPMHSDYIGRAFAYNSELMKVEPDDDIQRFEPSPLSAADLARRALTVESVEGSDVAALEAAWQGGFAEGLDGLVVDEDGEGPLWRLTLYTLQGSDRSAIVYAANHAISDQLSFNLVLSEILAACASLRTGSNVATPEALPLPPSVEGALLGDEREVARRRSGLELAAEERHPPELLLERLVLEVPKRSRLQQHPSHLPVQDGAALLQQPAAVLDLRLGVVDGLVGPPRRRVPLDEPRDRLRHHADREALRVRRQVERRVVRPQRRLERVGRARVVREPLVRRALLRAEPRLQRRALAHHHPARRLLQLQRRHALALAVPPPLRQRAPPLVAQPAAQHATPVEPAARVAL